MTHSEGAGSGAALRGEEDAGGFAHDAGFAAAQVSGGFGLGPLETQYEELFAEDRKSVV